MKRPSVLEVGKVLREKKLFESNLNKRNIGNWSAQNYNEWAEITGQEAPYQEIIKNAYSLGVRGSTKAKQVIRVSDGATYKSISECMRREGIAKKAMKDLINLGIEYKQIV